MKRKNRPGRKLLIASLGVAAVSYVACSSGSGSRETSGNLVGPDPDAASDAQSDTANDNVSFFDQVANLVPPDFDAGRN